MKKITKLRNWFRGLKSKRTRQKLPQRKGMKIGEITYWATFKDVEGNPTKIITKQNLLAFIKQTRTCEKGFILQLHTWPKEPQYFAQQLAHILHWTYSYDKIYKKYSLTNVNDVNTITNIKHQFAITNEIWKESPEGIHIKLYDNFNMEELKKWMIINIVL